VKIWETCFPRRVCRVAIGTCRESETETSCAENVVARAWAYEAGCIRREGGLARRGEVKKMSPTRMELSLNRS